MSGQLIRNFTAGGAINALRCVKFSAAETVVLAAAATDAILGLASDVGAASGERQDVILEGCAWAEAGAAITLGTLLTSDASGRVVTAAPSAGTNNRLIGIALDAAAAAGDQIRILVSPGSTQG